MPPSHLVRHLAVTLAGLVTATGLALTAGSAPAGAVDSPSGLAATAGAHPLLSWLQVPGATGYDVELSRTAEFTSSTRIGSLVSTVNTRHVPTAQLPTDTVWWRVRAKSSSTPSEWTTGSFTTETTPAPVPVRPLPDTVFQAPETPYFTWEPVAGATAYVVQTGRDPLFTDPAGIVENKQRTPSAYLTGYPPVGDYFWRVRAELGTEFTSAWTAPSPYRVTGLPAAALTAPADGFDEAVTDVVLDWEPVPGAATYQLQVSTDDGFLTTLAKPSGLVGTRWSPTTTLKNDEYYWRVRAVDASGNAAAWPDAPWRFRRAWPDQPVPQHPVGTAPSGRPLFYQWAPVERASRYTLTVSGGDFSCSASTVHTTYAGCVPEAAGSYTWHVQAFDDPAAIETDVISASVANFGYTPPAPVTPAPDGSLATGQVTGHATTITGMAADGTTPERCTATIPATCVDLRQTPVLTWDPTPGATSYRLTLAYDRELTNRVPALSNIVVEQPMYTFTKTLADSQAGSAYFWVVQPCAATCAPLEHAEHSFAKKSLAPRLLSPAADTVVADDVTLDWSTELAALGAQEAATGSSLTTPATTDARTYTVQTSVDPAFATSIETTTVDQTTYTSATTTYPEGYVYWRVRANDGTNNPTVWSETRRFEKRSPVPELLNPVDGGTLGADFTLSWRPLDFAASYDLEVYTGATRYTSVNTKHASWAPSDPLQVSASGYTWHVRRVDAKGRKGAWSAFRTFFAAGFQPTLASPDAGALVAPSEGLFTWLPDPRATTYRFERRKPGTEDLAESVTTRATAWAPTTALAAGTAVWRVVALDTAGKELGASPWRAFVVVDPPATASPVSISGSGRVGEELRVGAPTFDPVVETTTYQWYRGSSRITGATAEVYTVVPADLGKAVTVQASGALTGYKPATSTSSAITAVTGNALVATYPPTIDGDPVVGKTLTVVRGGWAESPTLSYQWYRDGVPIERATRTTYVLTAEDGDHLVHVVESAQAVGRDSGRATSEALGVRAAPALRSTARPAVTGTPKLGSTLTADPGSWEAPASYRYQWFRDGTAINGATRSTYKPTTADAATRLHVVVTADASGYSPGVAASATRTVGQLASTTSLTLDRTSARRTDRVVATVSVAVSGLSAPGGTVVLYDGRRKVSTVSLARSSSKQVRLPRLGAGRHTIKAVYAGTVKTAGSSRTARLTVTKR